LRALADAARIANEDSWRALAVANGEFLFREMVRDDRVFRSHKDGVTRIGGFLEDYAAIGLGAIALYELTFDPRWLSNARTLADAMVQWFWDDDAEAFFDTPSDHEELLTRPRDFTDNATPSGTSLAVELLLRLGDVLGEADMTRRARFVLESIVEPMARYPLAFGHALTAADMAVFGAVEVALAGSPGSDDLKELVRAANASFVPSLVLAGGSPDGAGVALLADRPMRDGRATAYVCRGFVCDSPVTDAGALWDQLSRASRAGAL
ncbi:MAG: thioredoxin domain-containing protein, partial [Gemmatimonadaceae bacterium]